MPDISPAPNRLARTSLILGLLGWFFYILQWCFDLTIGLFLVVFTGGMSAICSSVLDILPFALWAVGIVSGHMALVQIRQAGASGRSAAVWGLVLGYVGLALTILVIVIVVILVAAGVGVGLLNRVVPSFPKY
jgi:hypothetical protein